MVTASRNLSGAGTKRVSRQLRRCDSPVGRSRVPRRAVVSIFGFFPICTNDRPQPGIGPQGKLASHTPFQGADEPLFYGFELLVALTNDRYAAFADRQQYAIDAFTTELYCSIQFFIR